MDKPSYVFTLGSLPDTLTVKQILPVNVHKFEMQLSKLELEDLRKVVEVMHAAS